MLDYTQVLKELEHDREEIARFVASLQNLRFDVGDTDRYYAMNDMMTMIGLFYQYLKQLHVEATVCRQRKKTRRFSQADLTLNYHHQVPYWLQSPYFFC